MNINDLSDILYSISGLDEGQARACIFYALATHHMQLFELFPILELKGPLGTGKSEILKFTHRLSFKPHLCEGVSNMSEAALRDELAKANGGTFVGDEADCTDKAVEALFGIRCSRTGSFPIKRKTNGGWTQDPVKISGASVLHHRSPFIDQSIQSRAITIRTRLEHGKFVKFESITGIDFQLPQVNLGKVERFASGRAFDTWYPLLTVAAGLEEKAWLTWVKERIEEATGDVKFGQSFEPDSLIFACVVAALTDESTGKVNLHVKERVNIQCEIVKPLKTTLPWVNPFNVAHTLQKLGLEVRRVGGRNWVYVTYETLKKAADAIGYEDTALDGLV